jgi:hypothetical protein
LAAHNTRSPAALLSGIQWMQNVGQRPQRLCNCESAPEDSCRAHFFRSEDQAVANCREQTLLTPEDITEVTVIHPRNDSGLHRTGSYTRKGKRGISNKKRLSRCDTLTNNALHQLHRA